MHQFYIYTLTQLQLFNQHFISNQLDPLTKYVLKMNYSLFQLLSIFKKRGAPIFALLQFKILKHSSRITTVLTSTNFKCFKPVNVSKGNYLSKVSLYRNKYHKENSNFNISSCPLRNTRKACPPSHFVLFLFTLYRFKRKSSNEKRQQNAVSFGSFVPSRRE